MQRYIIQKTEINIIYDITVGQIHGSVASCRTFIRSKRKGSISLTLRDLINIVISQFRCICCLVCSVIIPVIIVWFYKPNMPFFRINCSFMRSKYCIFSVFKFTFCLKFRRIQNKFPACTAACGNKSIILTMTINILTHLHKLVKSGLRVLCGINRLLGTYYQKHCIVSVSAVMGYAPLYKASGGGFYALI